MTNVPLTVKELKVEYHIDPHFKDKVKYLEKDYCRYVGKAQEVFKMQCEDYVLLKWEVVGSMPAWVSLTFSSTV